MTTVKKHATIYVNAVLFLKGIAPPHTPCTLCYHCI